MNPRIIDQGDPRWASLPYPKDPWTVKSDGCGLCAVTMCAMELSKYWDYTPKDTIGFMRQYATNGNGTEWAGIDAGLDKYVGNHMRHYTMSSFWEEVKKCDRIGIILFGKGTAPDGTVWTLGGHYVMFAQYKYEDGQNWLYTKDSSYRHLDGWHSYEKSMKGCIPDVLWTAVVPKTGWKKIDDDWYYYKDGKMMKNTWAKDSSGDWFYVGSDGKMVKNDWAKDKTGKWFYLGKDGAMVKSTWVKWKGNWYYLKPDGAMASSEWIKDSTGKWCYLGSDGKMVKGCWVRWKNNMYYLDGDGYMVTGNRNVPCTFDSSGKLITK